MLSNPIQLISISVAHLAGEFVVVNKHLVDHLKNVGLWSKEMKDLMVKAGGSIQNIVDIPDDIKALYKTVWEISQKCIIDMAADRGRFIDQSSIDESFHGKSHNVQTFFDAHVCMETRSQDWYVLSAIQG
jgi:hypothetical protein